MLTAAGTHAATGSVPGVIVAHRPVLLGHRGASRHAPDNTIAAYRLAERDGADGIECDVRLTSDAVIVMHHEPVVSGLGALSGIDFATLRQVHPDVPTLDEVLQALPDPSFLLNTEIKNHADEPGFDPDNRLAGLIADWVGRHQLHARVIVSSFNRTAVDAVKAADAGITTGLLLDRRSAIRPVLRGLADDGHRWVLPHHTRLIDAAGSTVRAVHDAGLQLGTWTLDTSWRISALSRAWIDAIITNDPGAARRLFDT